MNIDKNFIEEIIVPVKECVLQASNEVMKIYRSDDFEVIDKSDGSPLPKADKKANEDDIVDADFEVVDEADKKD